MSVYRAGEPVTRGDGSNQFLGGAQYLGQQDGTPFEYGNGFINPRNRRSDDYASDTYADLVRTEYSDYKNRFEPYEQKLMSIADSEQLLDEQLAKISGTSSQRFSLASANSALMSQKYGIEQTGRQQNYNNMQSDLQRGLAVSQAKNMSRLAHQDRQMGILSGGGSTRQRMKEMGDM